MSWIDEFCEYAGPGEAPKKFFFWTGVSALACTVGRRIWADMGTFNLYPNLYVVLCSPPGIIHKSTIINQAVKVLKGVDTSFAAESGSWQALVDFMPQYEKVFHVNGTAISTCERVAAVTELGTFLNPDDLQQVSALIKLWDGDPEFTRSTKKDGEMVINNPCLNLLAGATPSLLRRHFSKEEVAGGLFSRIVFVCADKKARRVALPFLEGTSKEKAAIREELVAKLSELSKLTGPVLWSKNSIEWMKVWYEKICDTAESAETDEEETGYSRIQATCIKLALVAMLAQRGDMKLEEEDFAEAAEWMEESREDYQSLVGSLTGVVNYSRPQILMEVEEVLERGQQLTMAKLYGRVKRKVGSWSEFEQALLALKNEGVIEAFILDGERWVKWKGASNV